MLSKTVVCREVDVGTSKVNRNLFCPALAQGQGINETYDSFMTYSSATEQSAQQVKPQCINRKQPSNTSVSKPWKLEHNRMTIVQQGAKVCPVSIQYAECHSAM